MTKSKSTKRALLSSVLALVLTCTMLLGTTFAWFTDSVKSGANKIVAGNLVVELEYTTDFTTWTSVEGQDALFKTDTLWEPGHAEVVYLRVRNAGTLALKYKFAMNITKDTTATNVAGEEFKLSQYLKYGVVADQQAAFADRAAAIAAVTNPTALSDYSKEDNLLPNASDYVALVVYMPETVGNEANYRGNVIPEIELGVNLVATQDTVEYDSWDNQYDANAQYKYTYDVGGTYPFTINGETVNLQKQENGFFTNTDDPTDTKKYMADSDGVKALSNLVNSGTSTKNTTFALAADVDLNNEPFTPIGNGSTPFLGTFDGNNNTISNLTISEGNDSFAGLFGQAGGTQGNATIKNLKIDGATITAPLDWSMNTAIGTVAGLFFTGVLDNVEVSNANISGNAKYVGGLVGYGYLKIKNSYFSGEIAPEVTSADIGGIIGMQNGGPIENCYVNGIINPNLHCTFAGGIVGFGNGSEGAKLIKNCYFTGEVSGNPGAGKGIPENAVNCAGIVGFGYGVTANNCYVDGSVTRNQMIVANCTGDYGNSNEMYKVVNCSWSGDLDSYDYYGYQNATNDYNYGTITRSADCTFTAGMTYEQFKAALP